MDEKAFDALTWAFIATAILMLGIYGLALFAQAAAGSGRIPAMPRSPAGWVAFTA